MSASNAAFTHHGMSRHAELLLEKACNLALTAEERLEATNELNVVRQRIDAIEHERTKIVLTNVAHPDGSISPAFS